MSETSNVARGGIDAVLGQIGIQKGYITQDQLKEALAQKEDDAHRGIHRPLGAILVAKGYLTQEQWLEILEERRPGENDTDTIRRQDKRLGEVLIARGQMSARQLEECVQVQDEAIRNGRQPIPRLGEIVVQKGFASLQAVGEALAVQRKTILACRTCGKRYNVSKYDPMRTYPCRACQGILEPLPSEVGSVQVDDTGAFPSVAPGPVVVGTKEAPGEAPPYAPPLGKYTIIRELGRGGMGVVYEALDTGLNRKVALKMMITSERADPEEAKMDEDRFLREARLSANLPKHPHIVGVYEAGVLEGRRYLSMEFVDGQAMSNWGRMGSVTIRQQVALLRDVALAVHHAHEFNVIHRDLKPQNVLVDAKNQPHVTDFGLAKTTGEHLKISLTASGMIVGTPGYMSPEQARGSRDIDRRADVYSLGAMFYEVLTGRTPFEGDSPIEVLMKVVNDPVPLPSTFVNAEGHPARDRTVENICLKALAKDPNDRYATADDFATDLTKWLKGEDVAAPAPKPVARETVIRRAGMAVAALAVLTTVALVVYWAFSPPSVAAELEAAGKLMDENKYTEARGMYGRALEKNPTNPEAQAGQRKAMLAADEARQAEAKVLEDRLREMEARAARPKPKPPVDKPAPKPAPAEPTVPLLPGELRSLAGHAQQVWSLAFSPNGVLLASASFDHSARLWEVSTGRQLRVISNAAGPVYAVAFDRLMATGSLDGRVRLWNPADGKEVLGFAAGTGTVQALAFSPDHKRLASAGKDRHVKVWNVDTGKEVFALTGHAKEVTAVSFSPDGKSLASGSVDGSVRLWDMAEGRSLRSLEGHFAGVTSVAFSPDGRFIASGSMDLTVKIWGIADGKEQRSLAGHTQYVSSVAFSPDGKILASAGEDRTIHLWDTATGAERRNIGGHARGVRYVAFSPDGKILASAGGDGSIKLWDVPALLK